MLRKRSTYFVAGAILFACLVGYLAGQLLAQPFDMRPQSYECGQLSLLTWKGWSGDLCFLLIPMVHRDSALHNLTSKWTGESGVSRLREVLAGVPKDKYVLWNNWPPKFQYPSNKFCEDIKAFAENKGVHFDIEPVVDESRAPMFLDWQPH
jgi:hypothetical protein